MSNIESLQQKLDNLKAKIDNQTNLINNMNRKKEKLISEMKNLENVYNSMVKEENYKKIMKENMEKKENNIVFIKLEFYLLNVTDYYETSLESCEVYNNLRDAIGNDINWELPGKNLDEDYFPIGKDVLFVKKDCSSISKMILKKFL